MAAREKKLEEENSLKARKIGFSEVQQLQLLKYGTISENPNATTLASRAQLLDALMRSELQRLRVMPRRSQAARSLSAISLRGNLGHP